MKKVLLIIVVILIIGLIFITPQRISKGGAHVANPKPADRCIGLYIETYNDTPIDGDRGGWCFGKIKPGS